MPDSDRKTDGYNNWTIEPISKKGVNLQHFFDFNYI